MTPDLVDQIKALHPRGRILVDAIVVKGETIDLLDIGCPTCLTAWPCPTIRTLTEGEDDT